MQSTNEELTTLNDELQNRNSELSSLNNDLINLLGSIHIPILMLGSDLRIRRFTAAAGKLLNLIPSDVARLEEVISKFIGSGNLREMEVQDREGCWYTMRVQPYETMDKKIDGSVVTWVDINALKARLKQATVYIDAVVQTARESMLVLDSYLRVRSANEAFYRTFQISPLETENHFVYELGNGQWNIPKLRALLEEILPKRSTFKDFRVEHDFPHIGRRVMILNARRIEEGSLPLILLAIEDATQRPRELDWARDGS